MTSPLRWFVSTDGLLWWCLYCWLYCQAVVSMDYVYAPTDALKVNGKTVLVLINQKVSRNEAAAICKSKYSQQGGSLAKVDSPDVARMLLRLAAEANEDVWLGLYYKEPNQTASAKLSWSDQSCTDFNIHGYSLFQKGEETYTPDKRCYYLEGASALWRIDQCKTTRKFVCEYLDFTSTKCKTDDMPLFDDVPATFYSVPKNLTDAQVCTSDCSSIQGCFITWPGNKMCLFGVIDTSGRAYAKNRCIETIMELSAGQYKADDDPAPKACVRNNMSLISTGLNVAPISRNASIGGDCTGSTATETVVRTSTATVTTTSVQMQTTTTTRMQTVTTTDVKTMTTVSVYTTTITSAAPVIATTTYEAACSDTTTIIVPTTVTEISVSIQPLTVSTYTAYVSCSKHESQVSSLCPSNTVTKETINYVTTSTLTDCTATPCFTSACVTSEMQVGYGDGYNQGTVTKTVTEFDCIVPTPSLHAINRMETTNFDKSTVKSTTVLNIFPTDQTDIMQCAGAITTTVTTLLTTTETWTSTPSCDVVTPTQIYDAYLSTTYVTRTMTDILETNTPKIDTENPCHKPVNDTFLEQDIDTIKKSIIKDLTVPTANLSSTRRRKESIEDDRPTAKIPGMFACVLLVCSFGLLVLLDLSVLAKGLLCKEQKQFKKEENTRL